MNLSAPFIRRPIGTLLLTIGVALSGVAAYFVLPVAPLPQIDYPTISVSANMPGASPTTMASSVAAPLERRLQTIAGVTQMTSSSGIGSTRITLQFDLSRNVDGAARDVQAAINAARTDLPAALKSNPTYNKVNPADAPILILALTSDTRAPDAIYDSVSTVVQQALSQVPGVGQVELGGGALPGVRIDLDPKKLADAGINLDAVRNAVTATNANRPKGAIEDTGNAYQLYTSAPSRSAAEFAKVVVVSRNGTNVHLGDVAHIYDGPENQRTLGLFNGKRAVMVILSRQPGANIIATVDAIKKALPSLRTRIPADIKIDVASDRTTTIRASLRDVELTLLIATILVVLVVSAFLQSWRATVVPAVAVVVSILGTLGVMYLLDFSLDNLSLMALTIATGFVVDDAIVVLENINRHIEQGMGRMQAALQGAREVGFTVMAISISLVAVFIPLLFMGGLIGRLFREFAVTMTVAVLISMMLSLTTTPMIAATLLRERPANAPARTSLGGRLAGLAERAVAGMRARYERSLDWALGNRGAVLLLLLGAALLNVYLMMIVPKGFFPEQDTGSLQGGLRMDQSVSFVQSGEKLKQLVEILRKDPAIENVIAFTGGSRAGGGFLFATEKPRGQRPPTQEVIQRLRPQLARITGATLFLNPVQDMRIGGRSANSTYQYTLKADDPDVLAKAADTLTAALKRDPVLTDVDVDRNNSAVAAYLDIDHAAASRLGIGNNTIDSILYDAFGQRQVATLYSDVNQYHVVMGVAQDAQTSPQAFNLIWLPTSSGTTTSTTSTSTSTSTTATASTASAGNIGIATPGMSPLTAIATWHVQSAAAEVNHQDGAPAATISFNLPTGVTLGQASNEIRKVQASLNLPLGVRGEFAGSAQVFQQTTNTIPMLVLAAIVTIYLVLGILYENLIHPLTVLSTLPAAGVGAAAALVLTKTQFDLIGLIGVILLIGIVKKNAIMMIDFAIEAERRGLEPLAAIREAALLRFRPILMTTLAAGLGALPLAIGFGDGSELRRPLGITIIGGLIASQFLTLLTTPVVYLALNRFQRARKSRKPDASSSSTPTEPVPA
ncbi:efflux RND transporter permease subunit [Solilutibacter silvestris]|uniref:Cation/multidrug efflux pump n=1 Tax=Solilutibacter silvestris TaxID=1645665 RepID=A0A2K1Q2E5_9GAMM|nr:efflux RND transporter permease subunit [Lysobacter silvestris]PNS09151.1 Cation/multidrug efflux pump [Lysobacter silvestris]